VRKPKKAKTDIALPDRSVSMSNALARGSHALSLSEKRIVALALASIDSKAGKNLFEAQRTGWTVRLLAGDYAETFDVSLDTAYDQLKSATRALMLRLWRTVDHEPGAKGATVTMGQWASLAVYRDHEGCIDLTFHPKVSPHIMALRSQFTTYKLKQAAALRSVYAWRLFECLQSWQDKGRWLPSIEDFHKAMEAPESCRKEFGQLKRRVIDPAVKELRGKQGVLIDWMPVKAGRKVTGLDFKFQPDPQQSLPL
jgi:plasmid replication initiation protein